MEINRHNLESSLGKTKLKLNDQAVITAGLTENSNLKKCFFNVKLWLTASKIAFSNLIINLPII